LDFVAAGCVPALDFGFDLLAGGGFLLTFFFDALDDISLAPTKKTCLQ
jgi:hypothetical protein